MTPDLTAQLDELFAPLNRSDSPGVTVGVMLDDQLLYRRGFGMASLEAGIALSPTTKLRIGSTSKHFTALLALLLAEEGKLDLDLPVRTYLPDMEGPGGDASIRMLLQHRGGSRCYLDLSFIAHGMATPIPGTALALQRRQRGRNFELGDAVIYNNGGYQLVSAAIEKAGDAPLGEQFQRRLFTPLGMTDSALLPSDHIIVPGLATLHVPRLGGGWRRGLFPTEEVAGEGGIISTVDDMLRWTAHLRSRDRFGTAESWTELFDLPRFRDGSIGIYALGLMVDSYRGRPVVHHAGGVIGGSSQMLTFPDDGLDIVILSNGAPDADPTQLAERVADIVLGDRLGTAPILASANDHVSLLGHWWSAETEMLYSLVEQDGQLRLGLCGSPAYPLRLTEDGRGMVRTGALGDIVVDFELDEAGQLSIAFGSSVVDYLKIAPDSDTGTTFYKAVQSVFRSDDADCSLRFVGTALNLEAVFSDRWGESTLAVEALSSRLAVGRREVGQRPFTLAISVQENGDLIVSTGRTRFLRFSPIPNSLAPADQN